MKQIIKKTLLILLTVITMTIVTINIVSSYASLGESPQKEAINARVSEGRVMGVSTGRKNKLFAKDVNKSTKLLQGQMDEYNPAIQNLVLTILIIILCALAIRTELRFRKLANRYRLIEERRQLNPFPQKKQQQKK